MQLGKPIPREILKPNPSKVTLKTSIWLTSKEAKGNRIPGIIQIRRNRLLFSNLFDTYAPTKADAINTAKLVVHICKLAE
jgi:hypothetical protein